MKKILKVKWENIGLLVMIYLSGLIIHIILKHYVSDWQMWLMVVIAIAGTIAGYILIKTIRKCLLEMMEV